MKKDLNTEKQEIQELGLKSIRSYLVVDPLTISDKNVLIHLLQKAKLGMQFEREMNLSKRASEMNQLRIFKLTVNDKREMQKLIKASMPHYSNGQ